MRSKRADSIPACPSRSKYRSSFSFPSNPSFSTTHHDGQSIIRIYGTAVNGALSTSKCFQVTLNMTSTNTSGTAGNNLTPCS
jgi:hypothetical protein